MLILRDRQEVPLPINNETAKYHIIMVVLENAAVVTTAQQQLHYIVRICHWILLILLVNSITSMYMVWLE